MRVSVDISMYPLKDEFVPPIHGFIQSLNEIDKVEIKTNSMSTQIFGDYDVVMDLLKQAMRESFETWGRCIFVTKVLPDDSRIVAGHD